MNKEFANLEWTLEDVRNEAIKINPDLYFSDEEAEQIMEDLEPLLITILSETGCLLINNRLREL